MNIEVTKQTFHSVFSNGDFKQTEPLELANKHHYYSKSNDQHGVIITNFISNTTQYYLTDINA